MLKVALELPANKFLWLKAQVGIGHLESSAARVLGCLFSLSFHNSENKAHHFPFVFTLKELSSQDGNTTMPAEG